MSRDRELSIELSVKLSDDSFNTVVSLPVSASQANRDAVVQSWFRLIQDALKCCRDETATQPREGNA